MNLEAEAFGAALAAATKSHVANKLADPLSRLAELESRIVRLEAANTALTATVAALEQRPTGLTYAGVWTRGAVYQRDQAVTYNGSLWACRVPSTDTQPGTSDQWQLCVKRGADGRNGRDAA